MPQLFDKFIYRLIHEAENPDEQDEQELPSENPEDPEKSDGGEDDLMGELDQELPVAPNKPVFPEELELAKLAIRALYFNKDSKDVHNLKLKMGKQIIPFERIVDYFEKTKKIVPILSFVEWVMDKISELLRLHCFFINTPASSIF